MIEPKNLSVQIIDFAYESLNSHDTSDLILDIDFKDMDLKKIIGQNVDGPDAAKKFDGAINGEPAIS